MEKVATARGSFTGGELKIYAAIAAVFIGFVLLIFLVVVPWQKGKATRDSRHSVERVSAIHLAGFGGIEDDDLFTFWGETYFTYQVGACSTLVYVGTRGDGYPTYIRLKGIASANITVTYDKMRRLPQTKDCFIK